MQSKENFEVKGTATKGVQLDPKLLSNDNQNFNQQGYVLYKHAKAIDDICTKYNLIITVRKTGEDSLNRIEEGNPCKGHDILDKTIKKKSLEAKGIDPTTICPNYYGYVGQWGPNELLGVKALVVRENGEHYGIEEITLNELEVSENKENIFTGDYDLHDIIHKGGSGNPYSVLSRGDNTNSNMINREDILNKINTNIWHKDNESENR
ncbi:MAG: hypothetical protein F6K24_00335, partial [Okeania sp. SIO2D1]|nr:hypothetical protein [Okeania sp. SIO2D1]